MANRNRVPTATWNSRKPGKSLEYLNKYKNLEMALYLVSHLENLEFVLQVTWHVTISREQEHYDLRAYLLCPVTVRPNNATWVNRITMISEVSISSQSQWTARTSQQAAAVGNWRICNGTRGKQAGGQGWEHITADVTGKKQCLTQRCCEQTSWNKRDGRRHSWTWKSCLTAVTGTMNE